MNSVAPVGPAELFIEFWREAATWDNSERLNAQTPADPFRAICDRLLEKDDGVEAAAHLRALAMPKSGMTKAEARGRLLQAMVAIDYAFLAIHPRSLVGHSAGAASKPVPEWLREARSLRRYSGEYVRDTDIRLTPRGPLIRDAREAEADYAESLINRFSALSVAPLALEHQGRNIELSQLVIDQDPYAGVRAGIRPGAESVGYIPIATEPGEILVEPRGDPDRPFAFYGPAAHLDVAGIVRTALDELGATDCVVLPELVVCRGHIEALVADLGARLQAPRLVVAGSCLTKEEHEGLAWNECQVLNHGGAELWRQRKIWPAGINAETAKAYGLPKPNGDRLTYEHTASGDKIVIADIDSFGRALVLICQDLHLTMIPQLIEDYQPDWIFSPVLDCRFDPGRWAHDAAYSLSRKAQTRFVGVTSTALGGAYKVADPGSMGIAVGPKELPANLPASGEIPRAVMLVPRPAPGSPRAAKLSWRGDAWQQSALVVKPAPKADS